MKNHNALIKHINKKLQDKTKKWRKILKTLTLIEEILKNGSQEAVKILKRDEFLILNLENFEFKKGNLDRGLKIREKAKKIIYELHNLDPLIYFSIKKDNKNNSRIDKKYSKFENLDKSDENLIYKSERKKRSKTYDVKKVRIVESEFINKYEKKKFSNLGGEEDLSKNISNFRIDKDIIISKNEVLTSILKKPKHKNKIEIEEEKNEIENKIENENEEEKINYDNVDFSRLSNMDFNTLTKSKSEFDLKKIKKNQLEIIEEDEEINFL